MNALLIISVIASIWVTLMTCLVIEGVWSNRNPQDQKYIPGIITAVAVGWLVTIFIIWS